MSLKVIRTYINSEGEFIPTFQTSEDLPPNISNPNDVAGQSSNQGTVANSQNSSNTNNNTLANNAGVNTAYGNQTASSNLSSSSYTPVGLAGSTGSINAKSTQITSDDKFPNIFLNFRKNTFDNRSLIFKLDTDSLSSVSAGTLSNTWADSSGVSSLVLTGETSNSLKCAEAYGLKFYELLSDKFITNASYAMSPTTLPTYTIFVFALARTEANKLSELSEYTNSIHKFIKANSSYKDKKLYNISQINGNDTAYFNLTASTLTDPAYLTTIPSIMDNLFVDFVKTSYLHGTWTTTIAPGFNNSKLFNLYNLPSISDPNAKTAVTVNNGSSVNYNTFSLFFVEMHTYVENVIKTENNQSYYDLKYETFINRIPVYSTNFKFDQKIVLQSSENYKISISNSKTISGGSRANMFLFDYLQGKAETKEEMQRKSKNIIESLAYKYRNLLLKSTSDLQIVNSTSSLNFITDLCHPFVNFYAKSSS